MTSHYSGETIAVKEKIAPRRYVVTKIASHLHRALEKLARSSWGKQGVGSCKNEEYAKDLVYLKLAKKVNDPSSDRIYACTLNGFRFLEARRWRESLARASRSASADGKEE